MVEVSDLIRVANAEPTPEETFGTPGGLARPVPVPDYALAARDAEKPEAVFQRMEADA
ncbi:MAG: hypothetical protein JWR63_1874 [Conexibacter sp.]|nr:hypothetical protein [Conexibacter sp.]